VNPTTSSRGTADSPRSGGLQDMPRQSGLSPSSQLAPGTPSAGSVVVVVLVDFKPEATLWAWSRLVMQRWPLRAVAGLKFSKVLGSGFEGGFGLRPSRTRQGLFLGFESEAAARGFMAASPVLAFVSRQLVGSQPGSHGRIADQRSGRVTHPRINTALAGAPVLAHAAGL
jgi:hypothetical protein